MSHYKAVLIFTLTPGSADEELRRSKMPESFPNMLSEQPGFVSFESVKLSEDQTMLVQTWLSKADFESALGAVKATRRAELEQERINIVVSREVHGGDVVLAKFRGADGAV